MIPCLSLSRETQTNSDQEKILLGASEILHALEGYCSLCYMLSYKISVCGIN